jgi:hypothetical protein
MAPSTTAEATRWTEPLRTHVPGGEHARRKPPPLGWPVQDSPRSGGDVQVEPGVDGSEIVAGEFTDAA